MKNKQSIDKYHNNIIIQYLFMDRRLQISSLILKDIKKLYINTINRQRGFYLMEIIIILTVLCSLISLGFNYVIQQTQHQVDKLTASQLSRVTEAVKMYVQDHFNAIKESNLKDPYFTIKDLVNNGYLTEEFPQQNSYGHTYKFIIKKSDKHFDFEVLQVLLTTQGTQPISESSLRYITELSGMNAGYTSITHPGKIIGTHKGWILENKDYQPGYLASLIIVSEQEIMDVNTFLRRKKIAGNPNSNKMEVDLQIDNNRKIFFEKDKGFSLTKYCLESKNQGANTKIRIENTGYSFIRIEDNSNDRNWSTDINSSEINLKSGNAKTSVLLTNKEIKVDNLSHIYADGINIDAFAVRSNPFKNSYLSGQTVTDNRGFFSEMCSQYLKMPFIEIKKPSGDWEDAVSLCGPKHREGAMFMIGVRGNGGRVLAICADGRTRQIAKWK